MVGILGRRTTYFVSPCYEYVYRSDNREVRELASVDILKHFIPEFVLMPRRDDRADWSCVVRRGIYQDSRYILYEIADLVVSSVAIDGSLGNTRNSNIYRRIFEITCSDELMIGSFLIKKFRDHGYKERKNIKFTKRII